MMLRLNNCTNHIELAGPNWPGRHSKASIFDVRAYLPTYTQLSSPTSDTDTDYALNSRTLLVWHFQVRASFSRKHGADLYIYIHLSTAEHQYVYNQIHLATQIWHILRFRIILIGLQWRPETLLCRVPNYLKFSRSPKTHVVCYACTSVM